MENSKLDGFFNCILNISYNPIKQCFLFVFRLVIGFLKLLICEAENTIDRIFNPSNHRVVVATSPQTTSPVTEPIITTPIVQQPTPPIAPIPTVNGEVYSVALTPPTVEVVGVTSQTTVLGTETTQL